MTLIPIFLRRRDLYWPEQEIAVGATKSKFPVHGVIGSVNRRYCSTNWINQVVFSVADT